MNNVSRTLYIPLYGKAQVSKKGLFLDDKMAEEIWQAQGFPLKGKSKSKWLAYYMGIRSAVFDEWTREQLGKRTESVVLHVGCGLDSRILRVGASDTIWYDVDFADVVAERKKYFAETCNYKMLAGDVRTCDFLASIPHHKTAVVVMEGVSMYLTTDQMQMFANNLCNHFEEVLLLADCYTVFGAKMSNHKNPINDVGVTEVFGIDHPCAYETATMAFAQEHEMTPQKYIDQLKGWEKFVFSKVFAGKFSHKLYRLYEYRKQQNTTAKTNG